MTTKIKVGLATAPFPSSIEQAVEIVQRTIKDASKGKVRLLCFPESFIPGMRGIGREIESHNPGKLEDALNHVRESCRAHSVNLILPMDWDQEGNILNLAQVISDEGEVLGTQTKNQLDPSEDEIFVAGESRQLFEVDGVTFGVTICHEGFRYPESVRWAAQRGASIVFHPHCTGSDTDGILLNEFGEKDNPYFEKAMMCRALENNIFVAGVNYAFKYQESASCVIAPDGACLAYQPYGKVGLLIADIDISRASGTLAERYKPQLYL